MSVPLGHTRFPINARSDLTTQVGANETIFSSVRKHRATPNFKRCFAPRFTGVSGLENHASERFFAGSAMSQRSVSDYPISF